MPVRQFYTPRLEIEPPDLAPYAAGNTGVPYVTTLESGRPGPHVLINAITHGNEFCGAIALCYLHKQGVRPVRGRLTLSFANVAAFGRYDPAEPYASRYVEEDFNRLWDDAVLGGPRRSVELERARALAPFYASADYLLDLHSMHLPSPPLLLCGMQPRAVELGRRVGVPEHLVRDAGHAAGRRMRDYGGFDDPAGERTALLVECGQHWLQSSVDVARETCLRFLAALDVVDPAWLAGHLSAEPPPPQQVIEVSEPVTIRSDNFRFVDDYIGLEVIPQAETVIGYDGDEPVRTPYDNCVLVMPGRNLAPGLSAVRLGRLVAD